MPRKSRQKHSNAIYHIMCRSISEILLFRTDLDKDCYLRLLKRYADKYKCSIYAYCLMDNHLHIHFDPQGFDISKFMHSLNTAYVRYYNVKYGRHGSLFQGRFTSRIIDTDRYNLAVSAYIHNNPKDLPDFNGREEAYKYSSYGIYLGLHRDKHSLISASFIMEYFKSTTNSSTTKELIKKYRSYVSGLRNIDDYNELKNQLLPIDENEYFDGRTIILRELPSSRVISFISDKLMVNDKHGLALKSNKRLMDYRSVCAYILRVFSGLSYKEICRDMHNITISGCSRLCDRGQKVIYKDNSSYRHLLEELIKHAA